MSQHHYREAGLPADVRADLLAREMSVVEQCYQLTPVPAWWVALADGAEPEGIGDLLEKAPGHVSNFAVDDPARMAEIVGRIQRTAVERTRLGVLILFHAEALNGYMSGGHVYLGLDAHDRQLQGSFELTGAPRILSSAERSFLSEVDVTDV